MIKLTVVEEGSDLGVVLPEEVLQRLGVGVGDTLFAIETGEGVELLAGDEEIARQLETARGVMRDNREALRRLVGQ
jgi:putative addiction module antidote